MKPVRILHITDGIPPEILGGTGQIVWDTARMQRQRGHRTAIIAASEEPRERTEDGVAVMLIPKRSERWAHYRSVFSRTRQREVAMRIRRFAPDVVHAHSVSRQCGYRWMDDVRRTGIPCIHTAHDVADRACGKVTGFERWLWLRDLHRCKWLFNPLRAGRIRAYLSQCQRILCVSDALRAYLAAHGLQNLVTVHNGVDPAFWKPGASKSDVRHQLGLPAAAAIFLLAGRMGHAKGTELIAETLPHGMHLIVAGSGNIAPFKALAHRMHFFERQSPKQMRLLYSACDAVLVPSLCLDCFPTVCLEAMAMERPVIATSWGGAREAVAHTVTGWIIDPLHPLTWYRRMEWCSQHRDELEAMGKPGHRRIKEHFSLAQNVDRLLEIYRRYLAPGKQQTRRKKKRYTE